MFKNRQHAGELLANELSQYHNDKNAIVLAIPRGGVVPGYEISKSLHLPLEIGLVKKIGHPTNSEFAIGAVSFDSIIINDDIGVSDQYIKDEVSKIRQKMNVQLDYFLGKRKPLSLSNKKVIIVDDGIATGLTLMMIIELVKKARPSEIIVAIPVSPIDSASKIKPLVDKFICLETPEYFNAVGQFYKVFDQVEDETVKELLESSLHE